MQQRRSGRPSGTDGSDFSFRMVVDSRYTKVAKGKSRLCSLLFAQAFLQLIGLVSVTIQPVSSSGNTVPVSSIVAGLVSLLFGELGRRRSKTSLLRIYLVLSTITLFVSVLWAVRTGSGLQNIQPVEADIMCLVLNGKVIQDPNSWETKKFELIETSVLVLGLPLQILAVSTSTALVSNMSPPKKAS